VCEISNNGDGEEVLTVCEVCMLDHWHFHGWSAASDTAERRVQCSLSQVVHACWCLRGSVATASNSCLSK
jgi:hypothetical protein